MKDPTVITGIAPSGVKASSGIEKYFENQIKEDPGFGYFLRRLSTGKLKRPVEELISKQGKITKPTTNFGVNKERYNKVTYSNDGSTWKQVGKTVEVIPHKPNHILPNKRTATTMRQEATGVGISGKIK